MRCRYPGQVCGMRRRHSARVPGMFFPSPAGLCALCGEILEMALRMRKYRASPLESALTRKCVAKSFRIPSYKFKGLKLPWNDTVTKIPGGEGWHFPFSTCAWFNNDAR